MRRHSLALIVPAILAILSPCAHAQELVIDTVAGGGFDNVSATDVWLLTTSVLVGPSGEVYVGSWDLRFLGQVHRVDPNGHMDLLAGHGLGGPIEDGGPAAELSLGIVYGLALDPSGALLISEANARRVRRLDLATGVLTTVAGGGSTPYQDGLPATQVGLGFLYGIAVDPGGNLLIAANALDRLLRVDAVTGIITTVAGTGTAGDSGDGGPATSAMISSPAGIVVDAAGNIFFSDLGNVRVRRVDAATGIISAYAGTGTPGNAGDGGPATSATLYGPRGLALNGDGDLFISDNLYTGDGVLGWVRVVDGSTGIISAVAGFGNMTGEGIPALDHALEGPSDLDVDPAGNLFIADEGEQLFVGAALTGRLFFVEEATGLISTYAGGTLSQGDGLLGPDARLMGVTGLSTNASGDLFVSDANWIRRIDAATGMITRVAGTDDTGPFLGDGAPALQEWLDAPWGTAFDAAGNLFIAETRDHQIRWVDMSTGIIDTYAGDGTQGFGGDGGQAKNASLNFPTDVAFDPAGDLYIADRFNHRIRKVRTQNGRISTVAGDGTKGFGGDGGPATAASLASPHGVAFDAGGNMFIADTENFRIRRVDASTGNISTVAGDGTLGFGGDGGPATSAQLGRIPSLEVDGNGDLLLGDSTNYAVRKVDMATGIIDTVAGTGGRGFGPNRVAATASAFQGPLGIVADGAGGFFVGDGERLRHVFPLATPPEAGRIPGGDPNSLPPLSAATAPYGMITLSWGASCHATDTDFDVYEGAMASFNVHSPRACAVDNATSITFAPGPGSTYYLVVPRSPVREGSYGLDGAGAERPPSASACMPQMMAACP